MEPEARLEVLVSFFKALADENRLRIVGALASHEATVGELAAQLGVSEPTTSHHLARLKDVGLVTVRADGTHRWYSLDVAALARTSKALLSAPTLAEVAPDPLAWDRKVLGTFVDGERLTAIPASRNKREVVLRWLADKFERGVRYTERDVNGVIGRHHPEDPATLRRELVGYDLLRRDGGRWWRP
ncbi:MAG: metalloregulator ArsR/SmtB family transcription factor [Myxococcota bacterium]